MKERTDFFLCRSFCESSFPSRGEGREDRCWKLFDTRIAASISALRDVQFPSSKAHVHPFRRDSWRLRSWQEY